MNVYNYSSCIFSLSVLSLAVVNSCLPIVFCLSQVTVACSHTFTVYCNGGIFGLRLNLILFFSSSFFPKKTPLIFERERERRERERERRERRERERETMTMTMTMTMLYLTRVIE